MNIISIKKLRFIFRFAILGGILVYLTFFCRVWCNVSSLVPESASQKDGENAELLVPVDLPIERNSTLSKDIVRIWHEPIERRVCVLMKRKARCPHPALLGRLSGPSLALLEWRDLNFKWSGNVLCGSYGDQWLDAGEYFVEIIALYCDDFGFQALRRKRDNMDVWFDEDFLKSKCVEDAQYNRITGTQSRIILPMSQRGAGNFRIGRWARRPELMLPSRPLFTRYQPIGCIDFTEKGFKPLKQLPEWCLPITNRDISNHSSGTFEGLGEYDFQWGVNTTETEITNRLQHTYRDHSSRLPLICAVGDSHARFVVNRSVKYLRVRGVMVFIKHQWPSASTIGYKILQKRCEVVIILVGQWQAAFNAGGHPFPFGKYYTEMKMLVQTVTSTLSNVSDPKVYLPTVDMGPLMAAINHCKDWRTPTVLSTYSYMLQLIAFEESKKANVQYLDTNFIIQNHWDGDPDWLHLPEDVRYHKTIYILARIFDDLGISFCEECLLA